MLLSLQLLCATEHVDEIACLYSSDAGVLLRVISSQLLTVDLVHANHSMYCLIYHAMYIEVCWQPAGCKQVPALLQHCAAFLRGAVSSGPPPAEPASWALRAAEVDCICPTCTSLAGFLRSPSQRALCIETPEGEDLKRRVPCQKNHSLEAHGVQHAAHRLLQRQRSVPA